MPSTTGRPCDSAHSRRDVISRRGRFGQYEDEACANGVLRRTKHAVRRARPPGRFHDRMANVSELGYP